MKAATSGWQISGVTSMRTGQPFTPGFSVSGAGNVNITGSNTEGARIGVVAGCNLNTGSSDPFNRINAACFFAPPIGSTGVDSGVYWMRYPGADQLRHVSIQKDISIKERARIQLRADAFNIFNHANFTEREYDAELQRVSDHQRHRDRFPDDHFDGARTQCQR